MSVTILLIAWAVEATLGWPRALYRIVRHPVVWIGYLVTRLEVSLNRPDAADEWRYVMGAGVTLLVTSLAATAALAVSGLLPDTGPGLLTEALVASSLLASRSLYEHVAAVSQALRGGDLSGAREAVARLVGRDPAQLDSAGVARASLESLAENASDGVIAPLFWGAIFGLPGLAAYKAINTLDSMIGHRDSRYRCFGGFAARLDDLANLIPARLTACLIVCAGGRPRAACQVMWRDAPLHRSPNAGWPESALAGSLDIRLSGPRKYADEVIEEAWLNASAGDPELETVAAGLALYVRAMVIAALLLAAIAWVTAP